MSDSFNTPPTHLGLLPELSTSDRENLQAVVCELFQKQAIIRSIPGDADLYDWAKEQFVWVKDACSLIGFDAVLHEEDRIIYAIPTEKATLRKLGIEWTLVLLALWVDFDIAIRSDGPPVTFSVDEFNSRLKEKLGDRQPAMTSLREILRFYHSRKIIRLDIYDDFHRSMIEVLPSIKFVLPFDKLEKVSEHIQTIMNGKQEEEPDNG